MKRRPCILLRYPPMPSLQVLISIAHAPESSDQRNEGLPKLGKATTVHRPPLPAGLCVPRPYTCCGCVSASQFCLSYEEEDSGSGGCSVATAEWSLTLTIGAHEETFKRMPTPLLANL